MKQKTALITGVTGQDGSYLAELLLEKGYCVHALNRRSSSDNRSRLSHIDLQGDAAAYFEHVGDLADSASLNRVVREIRPDEVYNLASQSHVGVSFECPEYTADVNGIGTLRLLEAIRGAELTQHTRFYQASTSELFGKITETPQTEKTAFHPRSPYAVAKLFSYWITVNYRESYGMFACNGILFNHESPRRGESFVTRKITRGAARIFCGLESCLVLGNLEARRDWGHARDYIEAVWLVLQQDKAEDFIIASGEQHSVREFVELSFGHLGITLRWEGTGDDECGVVDHVATREKTALKPGDVVVRINQSFYRPAEVDTLCGDSTRAKQKLGWTPRYSFEDLVREMMEEDLRIALKERA
jgi:GDPmannose 4,6-dehydratase